MLKSLWGDHTRPGWAWISALTLKGTLLNRRFSSDIITTLEFLQLIKNKGFFEAWVYASYMQYRNIGFKRDFLICSFWEYMSRIIFPINNYAVFSEP